MPVQVSDLHPHGQYPCNIRKGSLGCAAFSQSTRFTYLICVIRLSAAEFKGRSLCRFDAAASELVCDEWAIAYPVRQGSAFLRPGDGRVMKANTPPSGTSAPAAPASEPWQT